MPVKVSQTRRTTPLFQGLYTGGVAPDWLIGNVGNFFKTELNIRVGQFRESGGNEPLTISCPDGAVTSDITLFSGRWADEGIGINDTINVVVLVQDKSVAANYLTNAYNGYTVTDISPDGKTITVNVAIKNFNNDNVGSNGLFPTQRQETFQEGYIKAWVVKDPELTALEVEYNQLSNDDKTSNQMASIIEGSKNRYSAQGFTPSVGTTTTLGQLGFKSGGAIKSVTVETVKNPAEVSGYYLAGDFIPDLDGAASDFEVGLHLKYAVYRVEIIHMLWGLEQDIDNYNTGTYPEWFNDDNALGDNFTLRFYNDYTNTNSFLTNNLNSPVTQLDAYTGWVGENYNGRPNDYSIVDTEYFNAFGTPVNYVDYGNQTKVNVIVNNPTHQNSSRYTVSVFHLPNELTQNEYSYLENTFANVPIYENDFDGVDTTGYFIEGALVPSVVGFAGSNGEQLTLTEISVTDLGSDEIQISFKTNPNTNYFNYFDEQGIDDRRLLILVSVQHPTDVIDVNNAVQLVGGYNNMVFNPIQVGQYPYMSNTFLELPVAPNLVGATESIGYVEDLWLAKSNFQIDLTSGIVFNSIIPTIELINDVTGEVVELERVEIDLTSQPIDGTGIQQFNVLQNRGFFTSSNNDKNRQWVIRLDSDDVPPFYHYQLQFGWRNRFEDWISRANIPNDFVDINELNDGLNNDWYWLQQGNWNLYLSIYSNTTRVGETALYKNSFPIQVKDYFQGLDAYQEHRHYEYSSGNPLYIGQTAGIDYNAILETGITEVQIDTILNTGIYPASGIYAYVDIQVDFGSGFKSVRTLSTIYEGESNDPLKPTGNNGNLLELVLVNPTTLRAIVLIEPSLLENGTRYRITKRIGCSTGNKLPTLPDGTPYDSQYNNKYL
jgi:hypothetical protein